MFGIYEYVHYITMDPRISALFHPLSVVMWNAFVGFAVGGWLNVTLLFHLMEIFFKDRSKRNSLRKIP